MMGFSYRMTRRGELQERGVCDSGVAELRRRETWRTSSILRKKKERERQSSWTTKKNRHRFGESA